MLFISLLTFVLVAQRSYSFGPLASPFQVPLPFSPSIYKPSPLLSCTLCSPCYIPLPFSVWITDPGNRGMGVPHPAAFWCQLWFYKWKLLQESEKKNLFFFSPTVELESHIWGDLQTPGKPAQELFVDSLIRHHGERGRQVWRSLQ